MMFRVEVATLCIIGLLWFQPALCGSPTEASKIIRWTCSCSVANQANLNSLSTNCSSSCDCNPGVSGDKTWLCLCGADELPRVVGEDNDANCFTACDCHSGTSNDRQSPKKQIFGKVVIIILSLCVALASLAIVASIMCCVYRKDKLSTRWLLSSPDKHTSFTSASNLISHGASSVTEPKGYAVSPIKTFIGCIPKGSFPFRNQTGAIHGTILQYSYWELEAATQKFSNASLIGVGGSSHVYRGHLKDGRIVAIKRIKTQGGPNAESVFLTEIELISRLHHCNVVPLLGYCLEHQGKQAERLLVFEYVPNGNLRECLDGVSGQFLDWKTRVSVALGAARGLEYLHEAAAPRILHRDVKSTNILLDENWRAKITDLGMAKHLHNDGLLSSPSSPARMQGTFGYFAPEYAIVGRASLKSDVFSFGVVLLELITGRQPIYKSMNKGEESLVIWATPRLHDCNLVILELPDPRLEGNFQEEEVQIMAYLAKECLLLDPDSRPTMSEVVQILTSIAPEKSKRKSMAVRAHSFQINSGTNHSAKSGPFAVGVESRNSERCNREICNPLEAEEIKQVTCEQPARGLSPSDYANNLYIEKSEKKADSPSNDVEKLMFLSSSKDRSWRIQDDVAVDLTEPRFESFCVPAVDSRGLKLVGQP